MALNLQPRFYHFLWRILRKKRMVIDGYDIEYIHLPKFCICGGRDSKTYFVNGMVITHRKSDTLMVFVSNSEKNSSVLRYTLYHEYLEGSLLLRRFVRQGRADEYKRKIIDCFTSLESDIKAAGIDIEAIVARGHDLCHVYALIMELALAKREMQPTDFALFFTRRTQEGL